MGVIFTVHKVALLFTAVFKVEGILFCIGLVKLVYPLVVEIHGVDESQYLLRRYRIFGDESAFGVVVYLVRDGLCRIL